MNSFRMRSRSKAHFFIITLLLRTFLSCSFTFSGDNGKKPSSGGQNYRSDSDVPLEDVELPKILQDSRSKRKRSVESYRRQRFETPQSIASNDFDLRQAVNESTSAALRLAELSEWANQGDGRQAEAILSVLGNGATKNAYSATIRAFLSQDQVDDALRVLAKLERSPTHSVKAEDYRPVLRFFIKIGKPYDAIRLLNHMAKCGVGYSILKDYDRDDPKRRASPWENLNASVLPDARCLMIVCNEFVKKRLPGRKNICVKLFEWAKKFSCDDDYLFNAALSAFDDPCEGEKYLLMHATTETPAICYLTVMQAYNRQELVFKRGRKMESLLRRLRFFNAGGAIQPDIYVYRNIMQAYLSEKDVRGAVSFLEKAVQDASSGLIESIDSLFLSWGRRIVDLIGKSDLPLSEVLEVIKSVELLFESKHEAIDIEFYHFVMDNLIRSNGPTSIPLLEFILRRIQERALDASIAQPKATVKTLNIVLKGYSTSRNETIMERAEAILIRMEDAFYKGGSSSVWPDIVTYSTVIFGWTSCRCPNALQRANGVARRLNTMYLSGNEAARPDGGVAFFVGGSTPDSDLPGLVDNQRVNALINQSRPDIKSLTRIIQQDQRASVACETGEAIINALLQKYQDAKEHGFLPDAHLFSAVMSAWGRSQRPGSASRAEVLLDKMVLLYDLTKSEKVKPTAKNFAAVIRAYSQPNQPEKAKNAARVLQRMVSLRNEGLLDEAPTGEVLTAVLKACAHAKGIAHEKREELNIAQEVYESFQEYNCTRNEASFAAYIGAVRNCMERGHKRTSVVREVFEMARAEGFVDTFILGQIRRSVSRGDFEEMVGSELANIKNIEMKDIPAYWMRSIR